MEGAIASERKANLSRNVFHKIPMNLSPREPPLPLRMPTSNSSSVASLGVMKSFHGVILQCNKFQQDVGSLFEFWVFDHPSPVGYMLPSFITRMVWTDTGFEVSYTSRRVHLNAMARRGEDVLEACQREFVALCRLNVSVIDGLGKWLDAWDSQQDSDFHPIRGLGPNLVGLKVPSPLRGVFGIVTAGAHMNMFTFKDVGGSSHIHVWVAKRTEHVTYAGKLDQLVAGAMGPTDDNDPMKTLRREAMEEAGLAIDIETRRVTKDDRYVGTVLQSSRISFFDRKGEIAGTEHGQLEPGIRFTFDLEVDPEFVPKPCEPESIAGFFLRNVGEVKEDLKCGEWKPNCALVMLDFLLGRCQIDPREDEFYQLLSPSLRRDLPFDAIE